MISPDDPRSGSISMSSGCQASGTGAAAAGGVQTDPASSHSYVPAASHSAPSRTWSGVISAAHSAQLVDVPSSV